MNFQAGFKSGQGRFRDTSPTISDAARRPDDAKWKRNRHLLALGYEDENLMPCLRGEGGAKAFFSQRGIRWWKSSQTGDDCTRNTPTRNLASSQVSCVNFLLPLEAVNGGLEAMLRKIDPEVRSVVPIPYNGLASRVEFEWIGLGGALEGGVGTRGVNVTSADGLVIAETGSGRRGYLIEWKCCEEYVGEEGKGVGSSGATRRSRYAELYKGERSSFDPNVPMDELLWEPFYQLMRLLLLGDRMIQSKEFGIEDFRVLVVCPPENTAYRNHVTSAALAARFPSVTSVEAAVRATLRRPERFCITSQEAILSSIRGSEVGGSVTDWSDYHRQRYAW